MKIQHVVVAGPNGALGPAVITNLLKAGFQVTILTRSPSQTKTTYPSAAVAEADYTSADKLTTILKNADKVDAVVCLMSREAHALQSQLNLIDATIGAGIPHYIPSSFGADMRDPKIRDLPPLQAKREMEEYVVRKAEQGKLTYTIINQGILLDWCLDRGIMLNFDGGPIRLFDHGKAVVSATVLDDLGKAVTNALLHHERVLNQYCQVHTIATSQQTMLKLLRELKPDEVIETVNIDTDELLREAEANVRKGDLSIPAMRGFIVKVNFGEGGNLFERVDNEVLGVREWGEEDLKGLIAKYVQ